LRPYTARTLHPADLVGEVVEPTWHPYVERAWREGRRQRSLEPILIDAEPVRVETVPVRHQGEIVAVLSVESPETPARPTGRLEASYLGAAEALLEMVAAGTFPFVEAHDPTASPRVGGGLVVVEGTGGAGCRLPPPQRAPGLRAEGDHPPAARPAAPPPGGHPGRRGDGRRSPGRVRDRGSRGGHPLPGGSPHARLRVRG